MRRESLQLADAIQRCLLVLRAKFAPMNRTENAFSRHLVLFKRERVERRCYKKTRNTLKNSTQKKRKKKEAFFRTGEVSSL